MWLMINGKQTYADMVKQQAGSEVKQEESDTTVASPSKKVKVEDVQENKDNEEADKPPKDDSVAEMQRLRSSLSRAAVVTSQRRRRAP